MNIQDHVNEAPERYLVSVQWSKGHHYFITRRPVPREKALEVMKYHRHRLQEQRAKNRRGARPIMRLLNLKKNGN